MSFFNENNDCQPFQTCLSEEKTEEYYVP